MQRYLQEEEEEEKKSNQMESESQYWNPEGSNGVDAKRKKYKSNNGFLK